jgi:predicted acetyltransferase
MTETAIRRLSTEEMLEVLLPLAGYAFRASPPFHDPEAWREAVRGRKGVLYFALFEDEIPVSTVAGTAMTQQVRGKLYNASGIWGVVTDPAARRKGYCWRLMGSLLAAHRDDGRPLSCLYPFRESFYERMGYVTFPLPRTAKFAPSALLPLLEADLGGEVERVLIGDGYDTYRDYVRRRQQHTHGMALFVHGQKEQAQKESRFWLALARVRGQVVGLMLYRLQGEEVGKFTLLAHRFYYENSQAKYLLLQWIARHVDQASEVELWLPATEQPETWLADLRVSIRSQQRPAPMGRIVDVANLGGMQTGPGCFAARISDPLCPWNEGQRQFETVEGFLQVSLAFQADCQLATQALAALIYGTHDPGDFAFRDWGQPSPEVQSTLRAMFPPRVPYLHEYFYAGTMRYREMPVPRREL